MDPAVLPTGKTGTAGKTARVQNIAKAIDPRTTSSTEANTIFFSKKSRKKRRVLKLTMYTGFASQRYEANKYL